MSKIDLNDLYNTLHRLNRQMHRTIHEEMHERIHGKGGFHHGQANLLTIVLKNNGASQRDLAELLDVRPSSMTEMLTKMEQSDLVLRKQDENDQRIMHIYLTEKGKKIAEQITQTTNSLTESLFSGLTETEKEQMLAITKKLCKSLEEMDKPNAGIHQRHGNSGHEHHCHHCHEHHINI